MCLNQVFETAFVRLACALGVALWFAHLDTSYTALLPFERVPPLRLAAHYRRIVHENFTACIINLPLLEVKNTPILRAVALAAKLLEFVYQGRRQSLNGRAHTRPPGY